MDLCSPYVVIRLLAAVGISLFGGGLYLVRVAEMREELVSQYNGWVNEWSTTYEKEFRRANFAVELGVAVPNASLHHYVLQAETGGQDLNMIPPGYYPDLLDYTPLQFVSDNILASQVLQGSSTPTLAADRKAEAHINVTLVTTTEVPGLNKTVQRLHVGTFQMIGEWPAPAHACDELLGGSPEAHEVNGVCEVLRAARNLCLVVGWRPAERRWAWSTGGKGCYQEDREKGYSSWVSADSVTAEDDLTQLLEGNFNFGAGVFEEHDPFLMIQGDMIEKLMSSPELEADACLVCGSILVTIFVVHWTVCEKMDDGELDRELTRILIATGAASAPPDRATADRIFRRRREAERRRAALRAAERAEIQAEARAEAEAQARADEVSGADRPRTQSPAGAQASVERRAVEAVRSGGSSGSSELDMSVASAADSAAVRRTSADDR
jgi:hypothetical protein